MLRYRRCRHLFCVSIVLSVSILSLRHRLIGALTLGGTRPKTFRTKTLGLGKNRAAELKQVTDLFLDAFWTGKVGGGAAELSNSQRGSLSGQQLAEFRRRYALPSYRTSQMLVCTTDDDETIVGCVGLDVESIPGLDSAPKKAPLLPSFLSGGIPTIRREEAYNNGIETVRAPLMSNLAVDRGYRRKGIAKKLVDALERTCLEEWGYDSCYLLVEKRNKPAIRLYEKLGYFQIWQDDTAKTLLPMEDGKLEDSPTVIVCMKKSLEPSGFGWFSF